MRKGYKHSKETKQKIGKANSISLKGRKRSIESIKKQKRTILKKGYVNKGRFKKGKISEKKGKKYEDVFGISKTINIKRKMSISHRGLLSKDKHPNWQGGKSFEIYPKEFKLIQNKIRERDNYICQECGYKKEKTDVHHIDFNKKNNNSENLICLCRSCHMKTNFKRKHWTEYFKNKIEGRKLNCY